jgi:hypothetical protein
MNATKTKLGLLGALVFSLVALPAYAAPPAGRYNDLRGAAHGRKDVDVHVHIGTGRIRSHYPRPIRYETRTETVLVEPAHYETRTKTVLVKEGHWEDRVIPGRREVLRDSYGNLHEVQVTPDRVERVWCPPVYETRTVRVLVPARYETRVVRVPVYDRGCGRNDNRSKPAKRAVGIGLQILGRILAR